MAFLDLRMANVHAGAGLVSTGTMACLSGQLQLIQGQLGMSSQVFLPWSANLQGCCCCLQAQMSKLPQQQPEWRNAGCFQIACAPKRAVHAVRS